MVKNAQTFLEDPFGCKADLQDALADPALDTVQTDGGTEPDGRRAAYRLALTLGRCRLYGVEPGADLDGVLPPHLALAAAAEVVRIVEQGAEKAVHLAKNWDSAVDPAEADNFCAALLNRRMEAWAVCVVLDEAQLDCADEGDARAQSLADAIDQVQDQLDRFDTELEAQIEILATVTGTHLLDNWRAMLAAPYKEDLPWWLDGRLEETACRRVEEAVRTLPQPAGLRADHGRLPPEVSPLPASEPQLLLAAKGSDLSLMPGMRLTWVSPDGVWRAVLRVPAPLSQAEDMKPRTLSFVHCSDNAPATELQGKPVWFGSKPLEPPQIDPEGDILVRLSDLRNLDFRQLHVGDPPVDWVRTQ